MYSSHSQYGLSVGVETPTFEWILVVSICCLEPGYDCLGSIVYVDHS